MKRNINISTEKIKRLKYIKTELRKVILKSIVLNKNIKNTLRLHASIKCRSLPKRASIAKQHKVCTLNGRQRGVYPKFMLSRHMLKNLGLHNKLQNIRTQSW